MRLDAAEPELARVQRALLAVIGGHEASDDVATWLADDHPREQVAVYQRMYAQRLAREVAREYPATRALLGAEAFDRLASCFAARRRSRSFTLESYADHFPIFLRRSRALRGLSQDAAVAVARYERLRALTLLAAATSPAPVRVGSLRRADGARLHAFELDVEAAWQRFARGERIRTLRQRRTFVAMFRGAGAVATLRVAPREAPLLRALLRGMRLEAAVECASAQGLRPAAIRAALERWVGAGLLRADPGLEQATR
jgi:hypothetical protein